MPGTGYGDPLAVGYPNYAFLKGLGALGGTPSNYAQSNLGPRSNFEPGFVTIGTGTPQDAAAALITTDMTVVPVPIQWGDEYNFVDIFVGGSAASTPTHSWAALFSGVLTTAKLVGSQSVDGTTTPMPASTKFTFTLGAAYLANQVDSPYGYLYVGIGNTGTAVPSLVSGTLVTAAEYALYPDAPAFWAGHISAAGATAPATITLASVTAQTALPVVVLR